MLEKLQTVLITGASGGIGEAFARQLAAQGKNLILVARSEDKLNALAGDLSSQHGVQTHVIAADLARPDAAAPILEETERLDLAVDLLINNAGYGKGGEFTELSFDVQANMIRLNVNTLVELTYFYLPAMRQRRRGGVINVGSTASFQPVPYMSVYGATKAFVLSFSEALAQEVAADGVTVTALCPGGTATGFQAMAGVWEEQRETMHTPDEVAAIALRAFERGKASVIPGIRNNVLAFCAGHLAPRWLAAHMAGNMVKEHK